MANSARSAMVTEQATTTPQAPPETFGLESDGPILLRGHHFPAARGGRACVVLVHGLGEHSGRYRHVITALTQAGYDTYVYDQRGHGLTAADPSKLGFFALHRGWEQVLEDLHRVVSHVRRRHPELPLVLVGHSMGSLLAQHYAIAHGDHVNAMVLSGSDTRPGPLPKIGRVIARAEMALYGPYKRSSLLSFLSVGRYRYAFRPQRTDYDWLSRDNASVDEHANDPLCGFVPTASVWKDIFDGVIYIAQARHRARVPRGLPILLISGSNDLLSDKGRRVRKLADAYRQAGVRDVTVKLYPGGRHEMFNELNRDEVFHDLIMWLRRVLPQSGTPDVAANDGVTREEGAHHPPASGDLRT